MNPPLPTTLEHISVEPETKVLSKVSAPMPTLQPGQILIKVAAAGVNRLDWLQRHGHYPVPATDSDILGLEVAGEVIAIAPDVPDDWLGHHVCALVAGGGYASHAVAHTSLSFPIPEHWATEDCASLPEACLTIWNTLFRLGRLQKGETVLIHGGSSGIGVYAIQILKALGHTVITTAGSEEKCHACLQLGADIAINYKTQSFSAVLRQKHILVDVVLDMVGGEYIQQDIDCMNQDGRIILIAFQAGRKAEIDLAKLLGKRIQLIGSTLRSLSLPEKADIARQVQHTIWPLLAAQQVRPVIAKRIKLENVEEAHAILEIHDHIGKLLLLP
ncbi:NAD(P)H-quinone oxidoreductase [Leeia oryzae]|uniref:NAD(P)H-quinone oxidoreductase n=1 Tax=Leeia oryzae TaxID=356662 RepID=UPI00037A60C7|nr:NAD(P)H-quinone oxidoreductase [Leeia oryzae]